MTDNTTPIAELKKEADELGVNYPKNITAEKLAQKIDEFYESKSEPDADVDAALAKLNSGEEEADVDETPENTSDIAPKAKRSKTLDPVVEKRKARELAARKTRVVTIIDNDQRVNNHTTTCTVNCSNEFFDLGTRIFPLNEKVEIAQGHLNTLKEVKIPQHLRDNKTGLSTVKLRPRYTISYEDIDPNAE